MAKAKKEYILKDHLNKVIEPGDEVILLVKERGFGCLRDAYLDRCLYVGHCQYGYQFVSPNAKKKWLKNPNYYKENYNESYNLREPQCVRVERERVLGFFKA